MYHFPKPGQANGSDSPTRPGMVLRALLLLGCASSAAGGIRTNYLGEDVFKVEKIVRKRLNEGVVEYLIKWEGWSR